MSVLPAALCAVIVVGVLLYLSLSPLNPDWYAYELIYDGEGFWLSEQSRDPLFLFGIGLARAIFGLNGYEDFRQFTAVAFAIFAALLAFGGVFSYPKIGRAYSAALFVAVTGFALSRFTIQIREGLASIAVLVALAQLLRPYWRPRRTTSAALLLTAAALIHAGAAIYLAAFLLPLLWPSLRFKSKPVVWTWLSVAATISAALVTWLRVGLGEDSFLATSIGDRFMDESERGVEKIALQLLYGVVVWALARTVARSSSLGSLRSYERSVVLVATGPLLWFAFGLVVGSVISEAPIAVTSSYSRLLYLVLGVALVIATFVEARRGSLVFCGVFMITDQVRIIERSLRNLLDGQLLP